MADKFGLRAWTINLRTWIFGFAYLVFKTTCIDAEKTLREGAFFFTRRTLFPPLDKRNIRDKTKGLLGHFGEIYRWALDVRCLSIRNRGLDSRQQSLLVTRRPLLVCMPKPYCFLLVAL